MLFSCNSKNEAKEKKTDIISRNKMVNVLVDCYLIEGALLANQQEGIYMKEYAKFYYDQILKKHKITRNQIFDSMEYYCFNIKELSKMQIEVNNQLIALQQKNQ
jgi:hypothetical protein